MPIKPLPMYGDYGSQSNSSFLDLNSITPLGKFNLEYFLNGYWEQQDNTQEDMAKLSFAIRPGTANAAAFGGATNINPSTDFTVLGTTSSLDRNRLFAYGYYHSTGLGSLFIYTANTNANASTGAPAGWLGSAARGGAVFTKLDGISYGANNYFAITDFTKGGLINVDGTSFATITDADFTAFTIATNFAAYDGYLFIGDTRNRIYNSDLSNASSWAATSFISANDYPGSLMWLERIRQYVIGFKQYSIEFFEDTGNPAPGSPLSSVKSLNRKIGLASRSSVRQVADGIIFLGVNESGKIDMYKIDGQTLNITVISNKFLSQQLTDFAFQFGGYSNDYYTYLNPSTLVDDAVGQSQVFNYQGKEFYAITYATTIGGISRPRTFVYDNKLGTWCRWASMVANPGNIDEIFSFSSAVMLVINNSQINVLCGQASGKVEFVVLGDQVAAKSDYTTSADYTYPMVWVTDTMDLNSRKRKFVDSLEILYDASILPQGTTVNLTLFYRNEGYQNTSPVISRTLVCDLTESKRTIARQLGNFRKRNWGIVVTPAVPFRLKGAYMDYNEGETDQDS